MSVRKAIGQKIADGGDGGWALAVAAMLFATLALVAVCITAYQIAAVLS